MDIWYRLISIADSCFKVRYQNNTVLIVSPGIKNDIQPCLWVMKSNEISNTWRVKEHFWRYHSPVIMFSHFCLWSCFCFCHFLLLNHLRCHKGFRKVWEQQEQRRLNKIQASLPTAMSPWRQTDRQTGGRSADRTFSSWGQEAGTGRRSYTASCPPEETTG